MRRRIFLISAILLVLFMLSLVYNPMIYAYIPYSSIEEIIRDKQRAILELDCIGWVIPVREHYNLHLHGGNVLCVDSRGRNVYEYIRFNVTLPGPGVWIYEDVFYLYLNVTGHRRLDIVVEKPASRHVVVFVFRRQNETALVLNASRVDRQVLYALPGVSLYSVSIIIHARLTGRESLRVGVYISLT